VPTSAPQDIREWFLANTRMVERLARFVCRDTRMSAADVDDFVSNVMLKLVENDYAVLRSFAGRCTISSYLIVVVRRALSDYRAQSGGKYRPSAEARRLGDVAMRFETLLRRDGRSIAESVAILRDAGDDLDLAAAERLAARLPERRPRPQFVEVDEESAVVDHDATTADRTKSSQIVSGALRDAIAGLEVEEQTLLRLRFVAGWSIADIARSMQLDQQKLYPRLRQICKALRERLVQAGVDAAAVEELIGRADVDLDFGLDQNSGSRPSSEQGERCLR
jgi:RNA polymerase sigma factor (sigma-70 family)